MLGVAFGLFEHANQPLEPSVLLIACRQCPAAQDRLAGFLALVERQLDERQRFAYGCGLWRAYERCLGVTDFTFVEFDARSGGTRPRAHRSIRMLQQPHSYFDGSRPIARAARGFGGFGLTERICCIFQQRKRTSRFAERPQPAREHEAE